MLGMELSSARGPSERGLVRVPHEQNRFRYSGVKYHLRRSRRESSHSLMPCQLLGKRGKNV